MWMLPLLQMLYASDLRTPSQMYMLLIIVLLLSQDAAFAGFPEQFTAFHWHGDTFALPPGCEPLMSSEACATQAYSRGARVAGIQFHLEVTAANARDFGALAGRGGDYLSAFEPYGAGRRPQTVIMPPRCFLGGASSSSSSG